MNSTTKAWIAAAVAVVFALGLIVWQVRARRSEISNLSAEDMSLIAEDQPPQFRARKITKISEITGIEGDMIGTQDLFVYKQTGVDEAGAAQGDFMATGKLPRIIEKLRVAGTNLPIELFEQRIPRESVR